VDEEGLGGITYPSDFAILKPRVDLVVQGAACAPRAAARVGAIGLRLRHEGGWLERRLAVFGDRVWQGTLLKLAPSAPAPFDRIPMHYERCFGGAGYEPNPVGVGWGGDGTAAGRRLPNFEDPAGIIRAPSDRPSVAGLGPLAPTWRARSAHLGSYGGDWLAQRWSYFPADFDWRYFQAAPAAQQLERLIGGEPFEIHGMRPAGASWVGSIPTLVPRCFALRTPAAGAGFLPVALRLDTVVLDVEAERLVVLWRGLLEVSAPKGADAS
jgi:hypothetical protein